MIALSKLKKIAVPAVGAALLGACATATPYQPLGFPGARGGYVNQQLDGSHWRVSFVGNTLTSRQQVENYLMYRAAELTLQQGSACFTMVNHDTNHKVEYRGSPYGPGGGFYAGWSPYWSLHGPWGWRSFDPWMSDPFWGSYDIDTVDSYEAMADIALSGGNCAAAPGTFNAQQVVQNLQPFIVPPRPR